MSDWDKAVKEVEDRTSVPIGRPTIKELEAILAKEGEGKVELLPSGEVRVGEAIKNRMKTTISKEFRFEAAHSLPHLPGDHPCKRVHGHSYRIVVHVTGPINDKFGWVIDYADISYWVENHVVKRLDHRDLNEFVQPSTAEKLAEWIWAQLERPMPGLSAVEVFETATSCARLER